MADISVPSNATIDRINEIIVGWYRSKAHETPTQISEVNKRTGIDETTISRQNGFLQDVGILQKEGVMFRLSPQGADYARFLDFGQLEEAKYVLRMLLLDWKNFRQIYDYIDLKGPLQKAELAQRIGLAAEKQPVAGARTGIFAVIDLLLFSGVILEQENGIVFSKDAAEEAASVELIISPAGGKITPVGEVTAKAEPTAHSPFAMNLTFNIDNSLDLAKFKELLRAIREVLDKPD